MRSLREPETSVADLVALVSSQVYIGCHREDFGVLGPRHRVLLEISRDKRLRGRGRGGKEICSACLVIEWECYGIPAILSSIGQANAEEGDPRFPFGCTHPAENRTACDHGWLVIMYPEDRVSMSQLTGIPEMDMGSRGGGICPCREKQALSLFRTGPARCERG